MAKSQKKTLTLDELFKDTFMVELLEVEEREPRGEIKDNEEVIGVMSTLERRLYALVAKYGKLGGGMELKMEFDSLTEEERDTMSEAIEEVKSKMKAARKLLWAVLKERLRDELWGPFSVGIRDDFKVVRFQEPDGPDGKDLLKALLGRIK